MRLVAVSFFVGALLLLASVTPGVSAEDLLTPRQAQQAQQSNARQLIDVRTPGEWAQTGLPEGAVGANLRNPDGAEAFIAKVLDHLGGDRSKPVALICASGVRSTYAQALLRQAGFEDVANVRNGMFGNPTDGPGWLEQGLPLQDCTTC